MPATPEFEQRFVLGIPAPHVIDFVYLSAVALATWLGMHGARRQARARRR